jgi:ABC-2 type transport system ATP-binding protein
MELSIRNLSKTYANGVCALDNVSLTIPSGMFGLLGPNGAGKSTLMRVLATLQEPDSGEAYLDGVNVVRDKDEVRRLLGYLPQDFGVYPKVSAIEMLDHLALLKGIVSRTERREVVEAMLARTNLWEHRKKSLASFSGGMRQRWGIAQALIGNPRLLIVDEPTAGLDPGERNRFHNLLAEIGENVVVILSTHIVDDVKELCTRMAVIHLGRVLYEGAPRDAIDGLVGRIWQKTVSKAEMPEMEQRHRVISSKLIAGRPLLHVYAAEPPGEGFEPVAADLEDVFFASILGLNGGAPVSSGAPAGE